MLGRMAEEVTCRTELERAGINWRDLGQILGRISAKADDIEVIIKAYYRVFLKKGKGREEYIWDDLSSILPDGNGPLERP